MTISEYCLFLGSDYLNNNQLPFLFSETINTAQKECGIKMIESRKILLDKEKFAE